ncbi:MAG: alkaline phosphatase [Pirellulaceae bacterium]
MSNGWRRFKILLAMVLVVAAIVVMTRTLWDRPPTVVGDSLWQMQTDAIENEVADWGHWGVNPDDYSTTTNHSNRLVPVYSFGITLDAFTGENSIYRDLLRLSELYGQPPEQSFDPAAEYMDQTDIYHLQKMAIEQGKKYIVLVIFDGLDWETTRIAAIYRNRAVTYSEGPGNGLAYQDYDQTVTDFGWMVTSPSHRKAKTDVNAQLITSLDEECTGGYSSQLGGYTPWSTPASYPYLLGDDRNIPHVVTDSAASATSMTCGAKTYNGAINVDPEGQPLMPIARELQEQGFAIGAVTSVPFSHATPACAYANNVSRSDYQDLARDMLGLPSAFNRTPLPGMDVVIGCGWGETVPEESIKSVIASQGENFSPANQYFCRNDLAKIDSAHGGRYQVALRDDSRVGSEVLAEATAEAIRHNRRLFGFFGTSEGHLPYATANGDYQPTSGISRTEEYSEEEKTANPTLRHMTESALAVLERNENGFWLMIEAGDVDWANHQNNVDDSIGAVFSGEAAFQAVCEWAENNDCWDQTAVILTGDHGHLFVIDRPEAFVPD